MLRTKSQGLRRSDGRARTSVPAYVCAVCEKPFTPFNSMQQVCGLVCARRVPVIAKKAERASDKARREKLKSLAELANEAQAEVNRYVRMRDAHCGCFTCKRQGPKSWDAGHLRSRGASPATRFILWAIRKQCVQCNQINSGRADVFYRRLVAEVGQEKVDWLYAQNKPAKWSRDYLVRMKLVFRKKANRQEKRNEAAP